MSKSQPIHNEYAIFAYPSGPTTSGYQFIIKHNKTNQLITITAGHLLLKRKDIVEALTVAESNRVYYYYGLEESAQKQREKQMLLNARAATK